MMAMTLRLSEDEEKMVGIIQEEYGFATQASAIKTSLHQHMSMRQTIEVQKIQMAKMASKIAEYDIYFARKKAMMEFEQKVMTDIM